MLPLSSLRLFFVFCFATAYDLLVNKCTENLLIHKFFEGFSFIDLYIIYDVGFPFCVAVFTSLPALSN